jgi:nucleotide-binding universal stress UspA family protein
VVGAVHADAAAISEVTHGHVESDLLLDASDSLNHVRIELEREELQFEVRPLPGTSKARALHEAAEQLGAGLVVVGSSRKGRAGRLVPGSTAARLLHGAPCPVAVVPCNWEAGRGLNTIGVAFVDTPEAHEALTGALALARAAGAKLRVLSAARPHGRQEAARAGRLHDPAAYDTIGTDLQAAIDRAIPAVTGGKPAGVEIEPDVSVQDPAEFLIAASENLDLLVCGSRGYGPQRAVLLGGVSRKVTAEARCPVIVLVRGADVGIEALLGDRASAAA